MGTWSFSTNNANPPTRPTRTLCRKWNGDNCTSMESLLATSEWHAIAMYQPKNTTAGTDVKLKLVLSLVTKIAHTFDFFKPDVRGEMVDETKIFTQYVNIHLGEEPMPRFGQNWYYGDIHYHSQGTDNDGESGYSFRSALQAMSAIGLDFAFATDHASNSRQIISMSTHIPAFGINSKIAPFAPGVLRDLSPDRFSNNINMMNSANGGNREVASYMRMINSQFNQQINTSSIRRDFVVPQLFLGAEVDVIPEYENGKSLPFGFGNSCYDLDPWLIALNKGLFNTAVDKTKDFLWNGGDGEPRVCDGLDLMDLQSDGRVLIRDVQGPNNGELISSDLYGRQHVLHLPEDPNNTQAFISSDTSKYGGATRRLKDILNTEFNTPNGIVFLAHPNNTPSGKDINRLGPDIAPYSEASLLDAFASQHVLGLQLWNENNYLKSDMGNPRSTFDYNAAIASDNFDLFNTTDFGDARSTRPDSTALYTKGQGVKGELIPVFDLDNWKHQQTKNNFIHGLGMWDSMLMWGLDREMTKTIDWLPANKPRRVFIAGGSDAHGDYNYRREGYLVGLTSVGDGAIGTPRNLLFAGNPQGEPITKNQKTGTPVGQKQIVEAFKNGNFVVTDGPIIRLAYDTNNNNKIDLSDIPMGGVVEHNQCSFPLLVEWKSTPEFGSVKSIELTIGTFSNDHADGWLYRAWNKQMRDISNNPGTDLFKKTHVNIDKGLKFTKSFQTGGWRGVYRENIFDPTSDLLMNIEIPQSQGFSGTKKININPQDFPVAKLSQTNICGTLPQKKSNKKSAFIKIKKSVPLKAFFKKNQYLNITKSVPATKPSATKRSLTKRSITKPKEKPNSKAKVLYRKASTGRVLIPKFEDGGMFDGGGPNFPNPVDPIDPDCIQRNVTNPIIADRMYIRARLKGRSVNGIKRKAFANPIWFNLNKSNIHQCRVTPDRNSTISDAIGEVKKTCTTKSIGLCKQKQATCDVITNIKGVSSNVCRWDSKPNLLQCKKAGGIWTAINSKYAFKYPKAIKKGKIGACLTDVKNLSCNARDIKLCRYNGAKCDVLNNSYGAKTNVCRWSETNESQCKRTLGIWTPAYSNYAKKHLGAVLLGSQGACISNIENLKNRIQ